MKIHRTIASTGLAYCHGSCYSLRSLAQEPRQLRLAGEAYVSWTQLRCARKNMKEEIRRIIIESGADVCGFANIKRFDGISREYNPKGIWEKCRSVIAFGVALPRGFYEIESRLIYSHFNDLSIKKVDNISFEVSKMIENKFQVKAIPIPCDTPYEYWDENELEGHGLISMKHAAVFAGLGSLGKNSLLINKEFGNRLTLGLILIDSEVESDEDSDELCKSSCNICINNCPVQAISKERIIQKKCRAHTYGKTSRGFETVECYKCRSLCPLKNGVKG